MSPNELHFPYSNPQIDARLSRPPSAAASYSFHFNQVEEPFLRLERDFAVPQLPIHHDVRKPEPEPGYLQLLQEVLEQVAGLAPQVFRGLSYLFDPADILRPAFYGLHERGARKYLYLLRLNLMYRPLVDRLLLRGDNDRTSAYSSRDLYAEASVVPLQEADAARRRFLIDETISSTWITETGRGYFVQGIWMDNDLTRFFSKLLLPPNLRSHPYYPYPCRYRTVCLAPVGLEASERERLLPCLEEALEFLRPVMPQVERTLRVKRGAPFSPEDPLFRELKARVPERWYEPWRSLRVEAYLNRADLKEYRVEHPLA